MPKSNTPKQQLAEDLGLTVETLDQLICNLARHDDARTRLMSAVNLSYSCERVVGEDLAPAPPAEWRERDGERIPVYDPRPLYVFPEHRSEAELAANS